MSIKKQKASCTRTLGLEEQVIQIHQEKGTLKETWNSVKAAEAKAAAFLCWSVRETEPSLSWRLNGIAGGFWNWECGSQSPARLIPIEFDSPGFWYPLERYAYSIVFIFIFFKNIGLRVILSAFEGSIYILDIYFLICVTFELWPQRIKKLLFQHTPKI